MAPRFACLVKDGASIFVVQVSVEVFARGMLPLDAEILVLESMSSYPEKESKRSETKQRERAHSYVHLKVVGAEHGMLVHGHVFALGHALVGVERCLQRLGIELVLLVRPIEGILMND